MPVPFPIDLRGRVAVVTGGAGVLCRPMALALAECGAKVAVLGRQLEKAQAVADAIQQAGGLALARSCNVLDKTELEAAQAAIQAALGPVTILINGAGGNHPQGTTQKEYASPDDLNPAPGGPSTFYDLTVEGVQAVFSLNFLGTFLPTQVFSRDMLRAGQGDIINISSMNAIRPLTRTPAYSAAKAGISNFTQWLAVHFSKTGIRVNAIAPGFFLGEQNRALLTRPDGSLTPRGQAIIGHTPQGRFGDPPDLVGALLFLLSQPGARFITGQVIAIDGGYSAFAGI